MASATRTNESSTVCRARNLAVNPHFYGPLLLLALTLLMYGDLLLSSLPLVPGVRNGDMWADWYSLRAFGFAHLRHGHIPMWNPHLFCGTPFFATFQTTLLYPLNWHYLVLPIAKALNVEIVLHTFLAGLWIYLWSLRRGLLPVASVVAAASFMFGAPISLQVFAGHWNPLAVASWMPLLFWTADELCRRPSWRWIATGIAAVALQILAGFPQLVYYTVLTVAMLVLLEWRAMPRRWQSVAALVGMYAGGAAIAAVQLLPSWELARDATRGHVTYSFATSVSLPPENLLTLLTPGALGSMIGFEYWGRWQPWEVMLYMGVCVLALAVWALVGAAPEARHAACKLALVYGVLMLLAMGCYTPLFRPLYDHVPGFGQFRAPARFSLPAAVLLAMLAGTGLDALARDCSRARRLAGVVLAVAAAIALLGLAIHLDTGSASTAWWAATLARLGAHHETWLSPTRYSDARFVGDAAAATMWSLSIAAAVLVAFALLLWRAPARGGRATATLIALLAVSEVFAYGRLVQTHFDLRDTLPPVAHAVLQAHAGDYRYVRFTSFWDNSAVGMGAYDLWGYESLRLRRYGDFMYRAQGIDLGNQGYEFAFDKISPLWALLRCRYVFDETKKPVTVRELHGYLPHLLLVGGWKQMQGSDAIFDYMSGKGFDPRREVVLEGRPDVVPAGGSGVSLGSARVVSSRTDEMTIEANVARPEILLVTDSYARGWKAEPLAGSAQRSYQVMPADGVLRAIPLQAGLHRIHLYYEAPGYTLGVWISGVALGLYGLWLVVGFGGFFDRIISG